MERVIPILIVVTAVAAWQLFLYRSSGGRPWRPLWMAFSMTIAAALFVVAGAIGYTLDRHDRFVARTAWTGHVIWSEVLIGAAIGLLAVYFWRKGLAEASNAVRPGNT